MKNEPLPLPNPEEWMTVAAVAHLLDVDRRTVERMIERKVFTGHRPWAAPGEKAPVLIWRKEALDVQAARAKLAAAGATR